MVNNENIKDQEKTSTREGNLNPMWGKKHSYATKLKMSQAQKKRYSTIQKVANEERIKQLTESPTMHALITRVINETLMKLSEKKDTDGKMLTVENQS